MALSDRTLAKMLARAQTEDLREEVKCEREQLAGVKRDRRERLAAITSECRALRARHTTDAKRQREDLRTAIAAEATAERLIGAITELGRSIKELEERGASDVLHGDLVNRGLFSEQAAVEVPF